MAASASEAPIPAAAGAAAPPPGADGDPFRSHAMPGYELIDPPIEGVVADLGDGNFSFSPGRDFGDLAEGERRRVEFTYRLLEPGGSSLITVAVTVTGTDAEPVAGAVEYLSVVPEARSPAGPENGAADGVPLPPAPLGTDAGPSALPPVMVLDPPVEGRIILDPGARGGLRFDPGSDFGDLLEGESRRAEFVYRLDDAADATPLYGWVTVTGTAAAPTAGPITSTPWGPPPPWRRAPPPPAGQGAAAAPSGLLRPALPAVRLGGLPAVIESDRPSNRLAARRLDKDALATAGTLPVAAAARSLASDPADPTALDRADAAEAGGPDEDAAVRAREAELDAEIEALLGDWDRNGSAIIDIGFTAGWDDRRTRPSPAAEPHPGPSAEAATTPPLGTADIAVIMGSDGFPVVDVVPAPEKKSDSAGPAVTEPAEDSPPPIASPSSDS